MKCVYWIQRGKGRERNVAGYSNSCAPTCGVSMKIAIQLLEQLWPLQDIDGFSQTLAQLFNGESTPIFARPKARVQMEVHIPYV